MDGIGNLWVELASNQKIFLCILLFFHNFATAKRIIDIIDNIIKKYGFF